MAGDARDVGVAIQVQCSLPDWAGPALTQAVDGILHDLVVQATTMFAGKFHDKAEEIADTGALAQSFTSPNIGGSITGGGTLFGQVISPLPYAIVQMETGRRAGAPFPPLDAIALWAQRKLGLPEAQAKRAAYPIARAIAQRGLPASTRSADAYAEAEPDVNDLIERTLDALETAVGQRFNAA